MAGDYEARVREAVEAFTRRLGGNRPTNVRPGQRRVPPGMLLVEIRDDSNEREAGISRIFEAFDATIDEFPDVLRDALPEIRRAHGQNFDTEGASGRGPWAPLAPSTLRDRARLGFPPGPILTRTGALRAHVLAADADISQVGNLTILRIRPGDYVGGVAKYRYLAGGTSKMPARPQVTIGPANATKVSSVIQRSLRARARAHGL